MRTSLVMTPAAELQVRCAPAVQGAWYAENRDCIPSTRSGPPLARSSSESFERRCGSGMGNRFILKCLENYLLLSGSPGTSLPTARAPGATFSQETASLPRGTRRPTSGIGEANSDFKDSNRRLIDRSRRATFMKTPVLWVRRRRRGRGRNATSAASIAVESLGRAGRKVALSRPSDDHAALRAIGP